MAAVVMKAGRPKMTMSAVQGRMHVFSESGERVGQWGGTECFLSWQSGLGPCLVVRSSRHKRHEGTFFQLTGLRQVLSPMVAQGKLTVVVPHQRHVCTVVIDTSTDTDELRMMAGVLQDKERWKTMERNVASMVGRQAAAASPPRAATTDMEIIDEGTMDREAAMGEDGVCSVTGDEEVGRGGVGSDSTIMTAGSSEMPLLRHHSLQWTPEQQRAMEVCRRGGNVFITGGAGSGKTEWLNYMIQHVLPRNAGAWSGGVPARTVVTASTGVAARLIGGGTVHSFAGIGRGEGTLDTVLSRVRGRPDVVRAWRACEVLVIDEVSMLPAHVFSLIDGVARAVRRAPDEPFGGIQLLALGDFLQLPPVSRGGEEAAGAYTSLAWRQCGFTNVQFTHNYRHSSDPLFAQCCADLRRGEYTLAVDDVITACLDRHLDERYGVEATMLMSRTQEVDAYNAARLSAIEDVFFCRYASEDYAAMPGANVSEEVGLPATLTLKRGAQVVLLCAIPAYPALANGDLGVVVSFAPQTQGPDLPVVRFTGGEEAVVSPVRVDVAGHDGRVTVSRTQIPLQLAWALTVHRVQGRTLPMARVKLDRSFFEDGQAYVAISRVRRAEDLSLTAFDPQALRPALPDALEFYDKTFPLSPEKQAEMTARRADERAAVLERLTRLQGRQKAGAHSRSSGDGKKRARDEGGVGPATPKAVSYPQQYRRDESSPRARARSGSTDGAHRSRDGRRGEVSAVPFVVSDGVAALTQESTGLDAEYGTQNSYVHEMAHALLLDDE